MLGTVKETRKELGDFLVGLLSMVAVLFFDLVTLALTPRKRNLLRTFCPRSKTMKKPLLSSTTDSNLSCSGRQTLRASYIFSFMMESKPNFTPSSADAPVRVMAERNYEPDSEETILEAFKVLDPDGKGCDSSL